MIKKTLTTALILPIIAFRSGGAYECADSMLEVRSKNND